MPKSPRVYSPTLPSDKTLILMQAGQHSLHATHELRHAALLDHLHHLLRLLELVEQPVHLLHRHARPRGDAALARGLQELRLRALLRRHRVDDALDAVEGSGRPRSPDWPPG